MLGEGRPPPILERALAPGLAGRLLPGSFALRKARTSGGRLLCGSFTTSGYMPRPHVRAVARVSPVEPDVFYCSSDPPMLGEA